MTGIITVSSSGNYNTNNDNLDHKLNNSHIASNNSTENNSNIVLAIVVGFLELEMIVAIIGSVRNIEQTTLLCNSRVLGFGLGSWVKRFAGFWLRACAMLRRLRLREDLGFAGRGPLRNMSTTVTKACLEFCAAARCERIERSPWNVRWPQFQLCAFCCL